MNPYFTPRLKKIEDLIRQNLPIYVQSGEWVSRSFGNFNKIAETKYIDSLIEPCKNLVDLGGKRWRPLLAVLCAQAAAEHKKNKDMLIERAYTLTPMIEFIHSASLIHDDIEDAADMRRGKPAAHIRWGTDTALNSASWLYFQAFACLDNKGFTDALRLRLYDAVLQELRRLHLGQAMDIMWHKDNSTLPQESEYLTMTALKTGTLASLAARCGILAASGGARKAEKTALLAAQIGVGFQIRDDITNLTSGNPGKKRGDDIVEGKKSLPLLYHIKERPQDFKILAQCFERAQKEGVDSPAVEQALDILNGSSAIQKAYEKSTQLIEKSCKKLEKLYPASPSVKHIRDLFPPCNDPQNTL